MSRELRTKNAPQSFRMCGRVMMCTTNGGLVLDYFASFEKLKENSCVRKGK